MQPSDAAVEKLKSARVNPAVLKMGLIQTRRRCPDSPIFAVEGVDDPSVYSHWVRRLRPDLRHEYFVCKGKRQVLMLHDAIQNDKDGIQRNVFFFIDRDFDDLAGHAPSNSIFMTDKYSTENYLVCDEVLDDILKIELGCHGNPELRDGVAVLFRTAYGSFLEVTKDINFRLFVAKRCSIRRTGAFPERINQIAVVTLENSEPQVRPIEDIIVLEREPTNAQTDECSDAFSALEPTERFRGKFALMFFMRWLDLLIDDHSARGSVHFSALEEKTRARRQEIVFNSLAARSPMPVELTQFLANI